ncbi:hypothetical protein EG328_000817 [Venturia inaequalis]|uniref:Uncharacterized protein n=1 Tax=Venturia inaequalis TaxID=5025 RepID=A0A8H3U648_VENIN|nr:hypothetical protein EG328_000817 [Venturia inaequalis]KAE9963750.1 hypothetical protein EG327_001286 [Venturia inaequalis]
MTPSRVHSSQLRAESAPPRSNAPGQPLRLEHSIRYLPELNGYKDHRIGDHHSLATDERAKSYDVSKAEEYRTSRDLQNRRIEKAFESPLFSISFRLAKYQTLQ